MEFEIDWRGSGWYGQRAANGVTSLTFIDSDPRPDWLHDRNGTISDVARRQGLGSPNWFDREPDSAEMAQGYNNDEPTR